MEEVFWGWVVGFEDNGVDVVEGWFFIWPDHSAGDMRFGSDLVPDLPPDADTGIGLK